MDDVTLADIDIDTRDWSDADPLGTRNWDKWHLEHPWVDKERGLGLPRDQMPQMSGYPKPGSFADTLPRDDRGKVSVAESFQRHLASKGIRVDQRTVEARSLKPSQGQLNQDTVADMAARARLGTLSDLPVMVSNDHHVIDGHHTWAARSQNGQSMPVTHVDLPATALLKEANDFVDKMGVLRQDPTSTGLTAKRFQEGTSLSTRDWTKWNLEHPYQDKERLGGHVGMVTGFGSLTEEEKQTISTYGGMGSLNTNEALRQGRVGHNAKVIDQVMARSITDKPMTVFRGMSHFKTFVGPSDTGEPANPLASPFTPGRVFSDKGFVSTTTSRDVGIQYAGRFHVGTYHDPKAGVDRINETSQPFLFKITMPVGTHAYQFGPDSTGKTHLGEEEVLLARNTRFRVDSISKDGTINVTVMQP